jgi:hypothetical protein
MMDKEPAKVLEELNKPEVQNKIGDMETVKTLKSQATTLEKKQKDYAFNKIQATHILATNEAVLKILGPDATMEDITNLYKTVEMQKKLSGSDLSVGVMLKMMAGLPLTEEEQKKTQKLKNLSPEDKHKMKTTINEEYVALMSSGGDLAFIKNKVKKEYTGRQRDALVHRLQGFVQTVTEANIAGSISNKEMKDYLTKINPMLSRVSVARTEEQYFNDGGWFGGDFGAKDLKPFVNKTLESLGLPTYMGEDGFDSVEGYEGYVERKGISKETQLKYYETKNRIYDTYNRVMDELIYQEAINLGKPYTNNIDLLNQLNENQQRDLFRRVNEKTIRVIAREQGIDATDKDTIADVKRKLYAKQAVERDVSLGKMLEGNPLNMRLNIDPVIVEEGRKERKERWDRERMEKFNKEEERRKREEIEKLKLISER